MRCIAHEPVCLSPRAVERALPERFGNRPSPRIRDRVGFSPNGADLDPLVLHGEFEPAAGTVHH